MQRSVNAPYVVQKRNDWVQMISEADSDKPVFLDESGVNTDMTRHYHANQFLKIRDNK